MFTLKLVMITMMVGSNIMPINPGGLSDQTINPPTQIEIVNSDIIPAVPLEAEELVPGREESVSDIEEIVEKTEEPAGINQDKTYEQCMLEALERLYEKINTMLARIAERDGEFQLQ